jgi:hypothetical protein
MDQRARLIGFSGKMRSGKTWAAHYLAAKCGAEVVSFADALKHDLADLGFSWEELTSTKPPILRRLMQVYGQAQRFYQPDYWLVQGMDEAKFLILDGYPVVIDDVRFKNEADAIRAAGGVVVRLEIDEDFHVDYDRLPDTMADESEIDLDDYEFDYVLTARRGDLGKLGALVSGVAHDLGWF